MKTKKNNVLLILILSSTAISAQIDFTDQATVLGLGYSCGTTLYGNGVSFFDYDNDGWDDITITTEDGQNVRFFKNFSGTFSEQILSIPIINYQTKQVNWVDIDNDGDNDLFVTSDTNGNKLFENIGNLTFQDISLSAGIDTSNAFTFGASWGDYNNDGYLDVFVSNRDQAISNILYKNNGDNTFTNVSSIVGISNLGHMSFCSAFFDFNNDGWQDIYISNDKIENANILYKNNGDGTFTDVSELSGSNITIDAMTVTVDDFNNDGFEDIYVTNSMISNVLLKNNGDETFTNIATSSGTEFNSIGWGASFLDTDNDQDLDLYVSGEFDGSVGTFLSAAHYENNNNETFTLNNSIFSGDTNASFSNAVGDVDNNGFPELVVTNNNDENMFLWKSNTINTNNWLKVNLQGVVSNKMGIGSKIEISIDGIKQYRDTHCGEGYLSQNSATEIFGLGSNTTIDYVKVIWLSGIVDIIYTVNGNQLLNIIEGSNPELSVDKFNLNDAKIYPNPVKDELIVKAGSNIISYEVFNVHGKSIEQVFNNTEIIKINTSKFSNGMYFIRLSNQAASSNYQFLKN